MNLQGRPLGLRRLRYSWDEWATRPVNVVVSINPKTFKSPLILGPQQSTLNPKPLKPTPCQSMSRSWLSQLSAENEAHDDPGHELGTPVTQN